MEACAFTGHRPNRFSFGYNENTPSCMALKHAIKQKISNLILSGVTDFYTGMALGVDIWAAEIVLELKKQQPALHLHAVIPCKSQPSKWPDSSKQRYQRILSDCDSTHIISEHYTPSCMHQRNRYMVDNSTHLIAVYDGKGKGGTAYTVNYANKKNVDIIIIPAEDY